MVTSWSSFIFWIPLSLIIFTTVLYVPGRFVIRSLKPKPLENLIISFALGIVLWGIQAYIFGYLNIRLLTYVYFLVFLVPFIRNKKELNILRNSAAAIFKDNILLLILILGAPVVLASVFTSALPNPDGIRILGINRIDGTFHLALQNSLIRSIPPEQPGLAGQTVTNYHYWSDSILSELVRIFHIPNLNLFFQYFPLFLVIIYTLSGYLLALELFKSKSVGRIFAFFLLFAGNLGYLIMFILTNKLNFGLSSIDNSAILFTNPPRAVAQELLIVGVITFSKWITSKNPKWGIVTALIFGVLVGFKVYVGIFAAIGLTITAIYFVLQKQLKMLLPIALTAALSAAIFFPSNKAAGGLFWSPLSWPRHYFAQGEASKLLWHLQEQVFRFYNNKLRLAMLHTQMAVAFLVITLGTRIAGILAIISAFRKLPRPVFYFLTFPTIMFTLLPIFSLQKTGVFEGFNFLAVSTLFWSLFAAVLLNKLLSSQKLALKLISIIIITTTAPRALHDAYSYIKLYNAKSGLHVSWEQWDMYKQMASVVPDGKLVLVDPRDQLDNYSPYIAAFTSRRMYFSGGGILDAHGLRQDEKKKFTNELIQTQDSEQFYIKLHQQKVDYYYENQKPPLKQLQDTQYFTPALTSDFAVLYQLK